MITQPKYNLGDTVYSADTHYLEEKTKCPYCFDGYWILKTPYGEEKVSCGVCQGPWDEVRGYLTHNEYKPVVNFLTIGQVRIEESKDKIKIEYMCKETGVGSGTIHKEENLFATYEEALEKAKQRTKERIEYIKQENERRFKHEKKNAARRAKYKSKKLKELGIE